MEKKFKPFDKVLSRLNYNHEWQCDFYSHQDSITKHHVTVGYGEIKDDNILPYEGNEELVGTTDEPEENIKLEKGELIIAIDKEDYKCGFSDGVIGKVVKFKNHFIERNGKWGFSIPGGCNSLAIRFKDFDPSNMEETRKHILEVKNGRIVRYKG